MKIYFSSKWTDEEIRTISQDNPPDLELHLIKMKDIQLKRICDAILKRDAFKPLCCMTKVRNDTDLSKCRFYYTLTDLLIREYNSGADFKFVSKGGVIRRLQLDYADGTMLEIYPFSSFGFYMYRVMKYGIINTDPILKNKYIFEKVWENRFTYLLRPEYLIKGMENIIK